MCSYPRVCLWPHCGHWKAPPRGSAQDPEPTLSGSKENRRSSNTLTGLNRRVEPNVGVGQIGRRPWRGQKLVKPSEGSDSREQAVPPDFADSRSHPCVSPEVGSCGKQKLRIGCRRSQMIGQSQRQRSRCLVRQIGASPAIGLTTVAVPLRVPARSVRRRTTTSAKLFFSGTFEKVTMETSSSTISALCGWGALMEPCGPARREADTEPLSTTGPVTPKRTPF